MPLICTSGKITFPPSVFTKRSALSFSIANSTIAWNSNQRLVQVSLTAHRCARRLFTRGCAAGAQQHAPGVNYISASAPSHACACGARLGGCCDVGQVLRTCPTSQHLSFARRSRASARKGGFFVLPGFYL